MGQIISYFGASLGRIVAYLPSLISGAVILVAGYFISRLLGSLVARLLGRTRFDRFAVERFRFRPSQLNKTASSEVGRLTFWLGILVTLSLAASSLKLYALSTGINRILGFAPHVLVAAVIVGIAALVGNLVSELIGDVGQGYLAKAAKVAVMVLGVFMALDELGIARGVVTTTFSVLLSAIAIAASIAFGVGNIRLAGDYTKRWIARGEENLRGREERRPVEPPEIPAH